MIVETLVDHDSRFRSLSYENKALFIAEKFDVEVTGRELWLLDEPLQEEEEEDLKLIWRTLI